MRLGGRRIRERRSEGWVGKDLLIIDFESHLAGVDLVNITLWKKAPTMARDKRLPFEMSLFIP
jgi:hypothetical protein